MWVYVRQTLACAASSSSRRSRFAYPSSTSPTFQDKSSRRRAGCPVTLRARAAVPTPPTPTRARCSCCTVQFVAMPPARTMAPAGPMYVPDKLQPMPSNQTRTQLEQLMPGLRRRCGSSCQKPRTLWRSSQGCPVPSPTPLTPTPTPPHISSAMQLPEGLGARSPEHTRLPKA